MGGRGAVRGKETTYKDSRLIFVYMQLKKNA